MQVLGIGADAAEDAEDQLDEQRRLDQAAIEHVGEVVEVADVVALELEAGAVALADLLQDVLDVLIGVAEDEVARALERGRLPVVLPGLVALEHRVEAEVHRAHVERAHLGLGAARGGEALLEAHAVAAAGGDVDHDVGGLLDHREELEKDLGVGGRAAVLGVARVQMHDRGAGLGGAERIVGDLLRA